LADRLGPGNDRLLLSSFEIVIIPTAQAALRHFQEGGGVGNVAEADQLPGLFQEAFGGMAARD
jgi:hypothetical protein